MPKLSRFLLAGQIAAAATIALGSSAIAAPAEMGLPLNPDAGSDTQVAAARGEYKPGDAQFDTLRALQARLGCQTNTLGETPVSRADFVNSLSACLNRVEPAMVEGGNTIAAADLKALQELTREFLGELTNLERRLERVDTRISQAAGNQFSTTTKLSGEVIFNLSHAFSGRDSNNGNTVFGNRTRLLLTTSFNGTDKLFTRLAAGNMVTPDIAGNRQSGVTPNQNRTFTGTPTYEGTQVSDGYASNSVSIDWLAYQFSLGRNSVYLPVVGGIHSDYAPTYNPYFDDATGGNGALSSFAESSPIYKIGSGAGVGTTFNFGNGQGLLRSVTVGYLAGNANNPNSNNGLFTGSYAVLGQINFKLSEQFEGGLTYVNAYNTSGNGPLFGGTGTPTGTSFANVNGTSTSGNFYGAQATFRPSDKFTLNGFAMFGNARGNFNGISGSGDVFSFGVGAALPNLGRNGSDVAGIMVGIEPYVTSANPAFLLTTNNGATANATPWHIEAFYKYKLADNISVTPGFIYLTAPNQTNGNSAFIGTLRTTFSF
jgi:hypothetical protein